MVGRDWASARALARLGLLLVLLLGMTTQGLAQSARGAGEHQVEARGSAREQHLEPAAYRSTVKHAVEELAAQHFIEAKTLFLEAHRIYPSARTLRALGVVEFELENYLDSIGLLQQALVSTVRPLDPATRSETEELLSRAQHFTGRIELELLPPGVVGVTLQVDGQPVPAGVTRALDLAVGEHRLRVSAPGYEDLELSLTVNGAEVQHVSRSLRVTPPKKVYIPPGTPGTPDQERPLYKNPWLWTGVGVLVVGAVLTGVLVGARDKPKPQSDPGDLGGVVYVLGSRP